MAKRQLSNFDARGPSEWSPGDLKGAIGELAELTATQRAWFVALILPSGREPEPIDYEVIERLRLKFFRVRERQLSAASYEAVDRGLIEWGEWTAAGVELLEHDQLSDELVVERLAAKKGKRVGAIRALLPFLRELAEAAAAVHGMHRPTVDGLTPFNGLVAEAAHYFRSMLALEPTVSPKPSLFVRWLYTFMQTLPRASRLHVESIDPGPHGVDTWIPLVRATQRALRATEPIQDGFGRDAAWWLAD